MTTETKETKKAASKKPAKAAGKMIHIKYYRSAICTPRKHKLVIKGLGFTHLNQIVERVDTPSIRGMVNKVPHLVEIVKSKTTEHGSAKEAK